MNKLITTAIAALTFWAGILPGAAAGETPENPRYTVVALVGIGHALKKGVPDEVSGGAERYRVILPEFAGLNRDNLTSQDADYLLLSGSGHE